MKSKQKSLAIFVLVVSTQGLLAQQGPSYLDTHLSAEQRALDLVYRTTLEEKASQLVNQQGDDPRYYQASSTPKHFAVHSGPESTRHTADVTVTKHDELDIYLPAFRTAVTEGKTDSVTFLPAEESSRFGRTF